MERQTSHAPYPVNIQPAVKPETIISWGIPLAFCVHLLAEIFLNGGFVFGVQRHIWPAYDGLKFGLVNAAFFILIILSSYLYSMKPDKWIIFPLFWLWERTWNGFWHVLWVLIWQEYSPGLVTSFLFPTILLWLLLRESRAERLELRKTTFIAAAGFVFELLLISTLFVFS